MVNIPGRLKKNFNSTPKFFRLAQTALITHKLHVTEPSEHSHVSILLQYSSKLLRSMITSAFAYISILVQWCWNGHSRNSGLFCVKSFELLMKSLQFLVFTKTQVGWIGYGRCAGRSHPLVVPSWFISHVLTLCYVTYKSLLLILKDYPVLCKAYSYLIKYTVT